MSTMFILRGLPGSGKSTVARTLGGVICSADDFFMSNTGEYVFDGSKLPEAHAACQNKAACAVSNGAPVVVIDNTNVLKEHMACYRRMGEEAGYRVTEVMVGNPRDPDHVMRCIERGIHGVPLNVIARMVRAFEL